MSMGTSHTGTGGTCWVGIMEGCHRERACMPWVGMLHRKRERFGMWGERTIVRREGKTKTGGKKEKGREDRMEDRKNKKVTHSVKKKSLLSKQHGCMIMHLSDNACSTRHTNDKVGKRCQTPDCSKKRNLWWLISDSIDIWTQRKRGWI